MIDKHMKMCSSLVIREVQIKTMRWKKKKKKNHEMSFHMDITKQNGHYKTQNTKCRKHVDKLKLWNIADGNVKWCNCCVTAWWFLKHRFIIWSSSSTPDIYPKELKSGPQTDICAPIFFTALITVANEQKQFRSPATDERIKKMYIHTTWSII